MRKLFLAGILFFTISCGSGKSGESSDTQSNNGNTANEGNSAGSNTIQMDTLHMDTSSEKILKDSPR